MQRHPLQPRPHLVFILSADRDRVPLALCYLENNRGTFEVPRIWIKFLMEVILSIHLQLRGLHFHSRLVDWPHG